MGRFLNDIPVFSKDKSGMNIAILIIQILFSLLEKEHGNAAEQIESIRKYCARHLTDGNTRRSYYFIKMLLQIPKGNFDKETVLQRVKPALEKLHSVPLELSNQSLEIEVVPYEALWELALASLERRTSNFTA
jgi:flagellin-specific chaperone FliS